MSSFLFAAVEKQQYSVKTEMGTPLSWAVGGWYGCGRVHMARFWSATACLTAPATLGVEPVFLRVCLSLPPPHSPFTHTHTPPRGRRRAQSGCVRTSSQHQCVSGARRGARTHPSDQSLHPTGVHDERLLRPCQAHTEPGHSG